MGTFAALPVRLDRDLPTSLGGQIAEQTRAMIRSDVLRAGTRLPSSRSLAAELGVARGVVEQGYDQLVAEGWLETRTGSGTFVSASVGSAPPAARRRSAPRTPPSGTARRELVLDTGTPWVDRRHAAVWRRAWRSVGVARQPAGYPDPAGLLELRAAVADHVGRYRGLTCTPDNVVITNGTTHGLALLLDELGPGPVAIEDPGYRAAAETVLHGGRQVLDVPVDEEGLDIAAYVETADHRALYLTPAHQHPLGMALSAGRRLAVLAEAARRDAVVVEDDYDSEFRYDVAPLPALAPLDPERVVYLGTASKSLSPALRVGWLVTTPDRAAAISERRARRHDHPGWPTQRALLSLYDDGYVDRQLRAARRVYAERAGRVVEALAPFGSVPAAVAGMYLSLATAPGVAAQVAARAAEVGVVVPLLADYCRSSRREGLVVGFGGVSDAELDRALRVVTEALDDVSRRASGGVSDHGGRIRPPLA